MRTFLAIPLVAAALAFVSCKKEEMAAPVATAPVPVHFEKVDVRVITTSPCDYTVRVGDHTLTGLTDQDTTLLTFQANTGDSLIAHAVGGPQQGILIRASVNDSLFAARWSATGNCILKRVVP